MFVMHAYALDENAPQWNPMWKVANFSMVIRVPELHEGVRGYGLTEMVLRERGPSGSRHPIRPSGAPRPYRLQPPLCNGVGSDRRHLDHPRQPVIATIEQVVTGGCHGAVERPAPARTDGWHRATARPQCRQPRDDRRHVLAVRRLHIIVAERKALRSEGLQPSVSEVGRIQIRNGHPHQIAVR